MNCGLPPPVAEEGRDGFPQRSENRRESVSPNGFPGTARRKSVSLRDGRCGGKTDSHDSVRTVSE